MKDNLPQWLASRLKEPLPGATIDSRFAPQPIRTQHRAAPSGAREAAVLLLLYPRDGEWHFPLMLRTGHAMDVHAGQVSLPGGALETGEATTDAAIREFHEELGDDGQAVRLLGALSPLYVQVSNFQVTPWVACVASRPRFSPNPVEVAALLEVSLAELLAPANFGSHERIRDGQRCIAPHFHLVAHQVWGATCMILGEFATILAES
jgi:8-oxo-dGTP pyrophosphatase MutT (NUDIX family)